MIQKYFNTIVEDICKFTDITDEDILEYSSGEVNSTEEDGKGTMTDPDIFGGFDNNRIGHIALPCPVVNINYLCGSKPILQKLTGIRREDLSKIIYGVKCVVTNPVDMPYPVGAIIDIKDKKTCDALTGAEAIEYLLNQKGIKTDGIIHRVIPVLPLSVRYFKRTCEKYDTVYQPNDLDDLTYHVLLYANRLTRLLSLAPPEIIKRNEQRMLQERIDTLVNNGIRFHIKDRSGRPYDSFADIYRLITTNKKLHFNEDLFADAPYDKLMEISKKCQNFTESIQEDNTQDCGMVSVTDYDSQAQELVKDIMENAIEKTFPTYLDYKDLLMDSAMQSFRMALHNRQSNMSDKKEDLIDWYFYGAMRSAYGTIKRIPFAA